jgi:antitoxin PrlF
MESALTAKGQATIPRAIRDYLRLEPGDRIRFFIHPDGTVAILPKIPTAALKGMVRASGRKVSPAEMDAVIKRGATARGTRRR